MTYCKTKTYINLKRIADRAYSRFLETKTDLDWEHYEELEMEVANYAFENEDEIDWEEAKNG